MFRRGKWNAGAQGMSGTPSYRSMRRESLFKKSSSDFGIFELEPVAPLADFECPALASFRGAKSRNLTVRFFDAFSGNILGCFAMVARPRYASECKL
jgi:hypothetical protein